MKYDGQVVAAMNGRADRTDKAEQHCPARKSGHIRILAEKAVVQSEDHGCRGEPAQKKKERTELKSQGRRLTQDIHHDQCIRTAKTAYPGDNGAKAGEPIKGPGFHFVS